MPSLCRVTLPVSTDWFNPSIAHQLQRRSEPISRAETGARAQYVPNEVGVSGRDRDTRGVSHDHHNHHIIRPVARGR
jgi:hypothetical protein